MLEAEHKLKLLIQDRPWETEPNHHEWVDKATKYKCEVKRHPELLHLCGYVTVPKKHHYYGMSYTTPSVSVHGGLTYSDKGKFGFDCGHAFDLSPGVLISLLNIGVEGQRFSDSYREHDTYRTFDWVTQETERLAKGLYDMDIEIEEMLIREAAKQAARKGGRISDTLRAEYEKAKAAWLKSLEE